jgi:hypothetical protein
MENIGWFVDFIKSYGVQEEYIFVTVDLYEKQNVWQVRIWNFFHREPKLVKKSFYDKFRNEKPFSLNPEEEPVLSHNALRFIIYYRFKRDVISRFQP